MPLPRPTSQVPVEAYIPEVVIRGPWAELDPGTDLERPGKEPAVSPDVSRLVGQRAIRQAFEDCKLSLDDVLVQRVVITWRVVRRLAGLLGVPASADASIASIFACQHPYKPLTPLPLPPEAEWTLSRDLIQLHARWAFCPTSLLLAPERVPPEQIVSYLACYKTMARYLGIPEGAPDSPSLGRYGLSFLRCPPEEAQKALPDAQALVAWERRLAEYVMEMLAKQGDWACVKWLRAKFALSDKEALVILDLARTLSEDITRQSEGSRRAMAQMRLEDIISTTSRSDPRAALAAIKTLAQIQGLTRAGADDDAFSNDLLALESVVEEGQQAGMKALGLELPD